MAKFVLDNFQKMTGGYMPGVNKDLHHRVIKGFMPHYFELAVESQDTNFYKKVNPPYPLVTSPDRGSAFVKTSNVYPVLVLPNEMDALQDVILSTNMWHFYSTDGTTETDMEIPTGTPTSNINIDAVLFNGKILTTHPSTVTRAYYGSVADSPSWTATTGNTLTAGVKHILKKFQDRCLITDSSSGSFTRSDAVNIVKPDFSIISGISLGDTYDIQDLNTFQDNLVLIFCRPSISPRRLNSTIVFLWDGVPGDSYDQKLYLKGTYKCSIEKNGVIFTFTQVGSTLYCYEFDGSGFREVGKMRNFIVSENTGIPKSRIGVEGDFFVILGTCPGTTDHTAPFYWNPLTGNSFILVDAVASAPFVALLWAQNPSASAPVYNRYLAHLSSTGTGNLYTFSLENTSSDVIGSAYKSNVIPAPVVKGIHEDDMGRMQIERIEIEYNTPPPTSDESIAFTLTTKDEHISETYTDTTATIKDTTARSTNAKVTSKRAIIDVGQKATEFSVSLSTAYATIDANATGWGLIIRRIVIYYQPIALTG
jgi:hypothetical protein